MNLYRKIADWIIQYSPLNQWIYFNATPVNVGSVAMNSVPSERVVQEFINGSKRKEIIFAIDMVTYYDTGTSETNLIAMDEVLNFSQWIEEQYASNNLPNFGDFTTIKKIEVLSNVPSMLVDTSQGLAKYQFQTRITYLDETEVIR